MRCFRVTKMIKYVLRLLFRYKVYYIDTKKSIWQSVFSFLYLVFGSQAGGNTTNQVPKPFLSLYRNSKGHATPDIKNHRITAGIVCRRLWLPAAEQESPTVIPAVNCWSCRRRHRHRNPRASAYGRWNNRWTDRIRRASKIRHDRP